jgi:hypothetical protein
MGYLIGDVHGFFIEIFMGECEIEPGMYMCTKKHDMHGLKTYAVSAPNKLILGYGEGVLREEMMSLCDFKRPYDNFGVSKELNGWSMDTDMIHYYIRELRAIPDGTVFILADNGVHLVTLRYMQCELCLSSCQSLSMLRKVRDLEMYTTSMSSYVFKQMMFELTHINETPTDLYHVGLHDHVLSIKTGNNGVYINTPIIKQTWHDMTDKYTDKSFPHLPIESDGECNLHR